MITNKDVALKILQVGKAGFTTQEDGYKKLDECIALIDKHVSERLNLSGVVRSKRFNKNDLLRAYQAGCLENLNQKNVPTSMEDLKELLQDGEKWYKRYTD